MDLLTPIVNGLLEEGLLQQAEAEAIRQRHQRVGGAPDTVILEKVPLVEEDRLRLLSILSRVVGRPPTLASGLEMPMPQALDALPEERRRKWVVLPYAEVGRTLYMATTALPVFDDATFSQALGRPVRTTVTLEVDLWAAFARHGNGKMPERLSRLVLSNGQPQYPSIRDTAEQPARPMGNESPQPPLDPLATLPPVDAEVLLRRPPPTAQPAPEHLDDPFDTSDGMTAQPAEPPPRVLQVEPDQILDPFDPTPPPSLAPPKVTTPVPPQAPPPQPAPQQAPPQQAAPQQAPAHAPSSADLPPAPQQAQPTPQPTTKQADTPPAEASQPKPEHTPATYVPLIRALDNPDAPLAARAQRAMLAGGAVAMEALFQAFPGRLRVDRYNTDPWALSAPYHSGVLATLAAFGSAAGPGLMVRLGDPSPEVRYYAAFMLAEIEHPEAATALVQCLFDRDPGVRSVSALALDARRGQAGFEEATGVVVEALQGSHFHRRAAAEAAGRVRLASAVAGLLNSLANPSPGLADPLVRALRAITGHDFGKSVPDWREWYSKHRHKHRIEWLLDGLSHSQDRLLASIWRELVILAGRDMGDPVRGTTAARHAARRSWRAWWDEEGRSKYPRWA